MSSYRIRPKNKHMNCAMNEHVKLQSVTCKIQENNVNMDDRRELFDCVVDAFPVTSSQLSAKKSIVHNQTFESAVVNIQRGDTAALSREDRRSENMFE